MKDKKVIIYIVLCIVIVCMMTGLVYAKVNYKGNTVQTEQKQPTPQVPKNHKKEILALIDIITVNDALEPIYNGQTYNLENINHKYVLRSTLNSIDNDKTLTNDELRSNSTRLKQCINAGYYSEEYLLNNINKIYGPTMKIDYKKDMVNIGFIYDSVNKCIYELCTNKIESNNFIDTYVYDYKEEGDNAYVYIAVAYGTETPVMANGGATNKTAINIYQTSKRDKIYKTYVSSPDQDDEFDLGKDNYNEFSKFKYTFVKENNQYHFDNIVPETNQ